MVARGESTAFALLTRLTEQLTHSLRTPLSVISNDLVFMATLVGDQECARAVSRCREIGARLSLLSDFAADPLDFRRVPLSSLLGQPAEESTVRTDERRLRRTLEVLEAGSGAPPRLRRDDRGLELRYRWPHAPGNSVVDVLARPSPDAALLSPLIVAFLESSDISVAHTSEDGGCILLRIPVEAA
jgi:signal transduction histidine kinase